MDYLSNMNNEEEIMVWDTPENGKLKHTDIVDTSQANQYLQSEIPQAQNMIRKTRTEIWLDDILTLGSLNLVLIALLVAVFCTAVSVFVPKFIDMHDENSKVNLITSNMIRAGENVNVTTGSSPIVSQASSDNIPMHTITTTTDGVKSTKVETIPVLKHTKTTTIIEEN